MRPGTLEIAAVDVDEGHVGVFGGELLPLARGAGIHQRRERLRIGFGIEKPLLTRRNFPS